MELLNLLNNTIPAGYQYAFATIISGVGFATIFPTLPSVLSNIFESIFARFFVTVMLLWQAGRTMEEALISSAVVWAVVMGLNAMESKSV